MKRWTAFGLAGLFCLALAALTGGGTAPFGRLALALGLPRLAATLLQDPDWRGVAEYRAGRYDAAAERFVASGNRYNLGNARARQGDYAAALEGWDGARVRGDDLAAANFDLLAAYYAGLALDPTVPVAWFTEKDPGDEPPVASFVARGNARAAGTGEGNTNSGALIGLPEILSTGQDRVRRVFDDRFMVANRRWLTSLEDVPGEYLGARIAHERKRRRDLGLAPPDPEDPE